MNKRFIIKSRSFIFMKEIFGLSNFALVVEISLRRI